MLRSIDLRIDKRIQDPEYRHAYYETTEENLIATWRHSLGAFGCVANLLTLGWWAKKYCPRPTAGDVDAFVQAQVREDAATRRSE